MKDKYPPINPEIPLLPPRRRLQSRPVAGRSLGRGYAPDEALALQRDVGGHLRVGAPGTCRGPIRLRLARPRDGHDRRKRRCDRPGDAQRRAPGVDGAEVPGGAARPPRPAAQSLRRAAQPLPHVARLPRESAHHQQQAGGALRRSSRRWPSGTSPTSTAATATATCAARPSSNGSRRSTARWTRSITPGGRLSGATPTPTGTSSSRPAPSARRRCTA